MFLDKLFYFINKKIFRRLLEYNLALEGLQPAFPGTILVTTDYITSSKLLRYFFSNFSRKIKLVISLQEISPLEC